MGLSLYLESQKQQIAADIAIQNALKKKNPDLSKASGFIDTKISIFGANLREEIRQKASQCNEASNQVLFAKQKNSNDVAKNCIDVNEKIAELQLMADWTDATIQDIANVKGISGAAQNALQQNLGETMQTASSTISNSISHANETLSKVKTEQNNPASNIIEATQEHLQNVSENTDQLTTQQTGTTLTTNNQNIGTSVLTKDTPKTETKNNSDASEKKSKIDIKS